MWTTITPMTLVWKNIAIHHEWVDMGAGMEMLGLPVFDVFMGNISISGPTNRYP